MNNWSIKKRVLVLALFPALIIAISLALYFNYNRLNYIEDALINKGESLAKLLAPACEYGVFSGNLDILENLISRTLSEADVTNITITNTYNEILISRSKQEKPTTRSVFALLMEDEQLKFESAITTSDIPIDDYDDLFDGSITTHVNIDTKVIGYIHVTLSTLSTRAEQLDSMLKGLMITFAGLILTAYLAIRISHSVVDPIQELTKAVKQIAHGKLNTRININTGGEIGSLERGVNTMAEEIQQVRQDLQTQVNKSTSKLTKTLDELEIQNIELDLARNQALSASRIKSEFLANMSHEIRTPMNGVLGFTELLAKTELTEQQKDFVNTINSSASNLLTIINDILDFSKIESGKLNIEQVTFSLSDIMDEIISMFAPMAYKKNIELIYLPYPHTPETLIGDPTRIRQVLVNLISNAIKFTHRGHVIIRILVISQEENNIELKFTVTDTGIGMDDINKQRLFTAFTQADTSISRQFGGTGLGLVISKKLAQLMHGNIGFDSALNKGSTFWFSLPLTTNTPAAEPKEDCDHSDVTVILFETSAQNRIALRTILDRLGVNTIETGRIDKFPELLEQNTVTAIVAGINRTNIRNTQFIEKLASTLNNTDLPYITLASAYDSQEIFNISETGLQNIFYRCSHQKLLFDNLSRLLLTDNYMQKNKLPSIQNEKPQHDSWDEIQLLIVDDNIINLKLACSLLQSRNIQVTTAEDGEQALKLAQENFYDLILMDLHMPKIDGFQATETIRKSNAPCKDTVIIALTANAMPEEKIHAYNTGMNDILIKPITELQLFDMIERWLNISEKSVSSKNQATKDVNNRTTDNEFSAYDKTEGIQLAGGNEQLANELLTMLIKELPDHKQKLKTAKTNNDLEQLKKHIHKLHGATSYCGVPLLRTAARDLEEAIDKKNFQNLDACYEQVIDRLDELLALEIA